MRLFLDVFLRKIKKKLSFDQARKSTFGMSVLSLALGKIHAIKRHHFTCPFFLKQACNFKILLDFRCSKPA